MSCLNLYALTVTTPRYWELYARDEQDDGQRGEQSEAERDEEISRLLRLAAVLTAREWQVLFLVGKLGWSHKDTATELGISADTVRRHKSCAISTLQRLTPEQLAELQYDITVPSLSQHSDAARAGDGALFDLRRDDRDTGVDAGALETAQDRLAAEVTQPERFSDVAQQMPRTKIRTRADKQATDPARREPRDRKR